VSRQTLWLDPGATEFETLCRACTVDLADGRIFSLSAQTVRVAGTLPGEADAGLATCARGHRVVVRRAASLPLAAAR